MLAVRPHDIPFVRPLPVPHLAVPRYVDSPRPIPSPLHSHSPSPPDSALMSPDGQPSPPSPPRSLEDQVHVAYALDDIHLAKVLLLRLKGINVTGDDDPRIAAVKDEDFDFCFVPHGRLEYVQDDKFAVQRERHEHNLLQQRLRAERLRACERIWVQEKARLRDALLAAASRRDADVRCREEVERRDRVQERDASVNAERRARVSKRRTPSAIPAPRSLVSYKLVPSDPSGEPEPFVYDFMVPHVPHSPPSLSSRSSRSFSGPLFDDSRAVSFSEVLNSMQGYLFPPEPATPISCRRRDADLLHCLLKAVEWSAEERTRKNSAATGRICLQRRDSAKSSTSLCAGCSSTSSSLLPPPSAISRKSWLSFSSSSSSTCSSGTTSPVRKPTTSWFSSSSSSISSRPTSVPPSSCSVLPHSCGRLTPVSHTESPLPPHTYVIHKSSASLSYSPASVLQYAGASSLSDATTPAGLMLRRISHFIELAKTFQSAYMNATLGIPSLETSLEHDNRRIVRLKRNVGAAKYGSKNEQRLRPPGERASCVNVTAFLHGSPSSGSPRHTEDAENMPFPPPIPLRCRSIVPSDIAGTLRTKLPDPLPFPLRFKPLPVPCRSPFRLHVAARARELRCHGESGEGINDDGEGWAESVVEVETKVQNGYEHHGLHPSRFAFTGVTRGGMLLRVRAVENPVHLRIRAVCNVVRDGRGCLEEGAVKGMNGREVKEGTLGAGKERVLQVAFEGIGRSWLGCEGVWPGSMLEVHRERGRVVERDRERGRREPRGKSTVSSGMQWWC